MKYVVDTCIINKLIDGLIKLEQLPQDGVFLASHIQKDEINKTPDKERKAKLLLKFSNTITQFVPTEAAYTNISRTNESKTSNGILFKSIKDEIDCRNKKKPNNIQDTLIIITAINNKYTLLTSDGDMEKVARNHGCKVKYFEI